VLQLSLRGQHPKSAKMWEALLRDDSLLFGLASLTIAVGAAWLWVRNMPVPSPEQILEKIVSLDLSYESGRISKAVYTKLRSDLKGQLKFLLRRRSKQ
ncbi:MAG: hypothetical protein WD740_02295, partial [Anaerolineales bacterium]